MIETMSKFMKQVGVATAALALVFAMAGTASAVTTYATVTGHGASSSDNNNPDWWETGDISNCTKLDAGEGDLGSDVNGYVLTADYELVIVKAGSGQSAGDNALTLFANASAGETVFADTNGNNVSDPGGQGGDKNISHIIFCDVTETTTTTTTDVVTTTTTDVVTTTTTTDTFSSETGGETDAPSEPNTATLGTSTGAPADGAWLLVIALGVLLASIVVMTPAKARR
jgi:hypothetical protein